MKLVITEDISLDGVIDGPDVDKDDKHSDWTIPY